MIFKLEFTDKTEFAQAKSQLHLLQSYESEYEGFQDILNVEEISEEAAKTIMFTNTDTSTFDICPEISLYNSVCGDYFSIVGSTEW